jgi:putative colanic acid biosynthesis UDP-glucose lipid carrier transferase
MQYNAEFSYASKLLWIVSTPAAMASARVVLRKIQQRLRARGFNTRSYAICGVNELGIQLARNIESAPEMGLRLEGFYDDRPEARTAKIPLRSWPKVGNLDELISRARRGRVDIIYITFPMRAEERIRDVLAKLADSTASVYIVPDFFVFELLHARWTNVNGLPAVSVFENPLYGVDGLAKRSVDLLLGSLCLAAAALPMLVIVALVKLTSAGPVFFRQRRYGLDGREILVWKFRSMTCCDDGPNVMQATQDDARVTRVGRFLRRSSLDELPQLFNVLDGSMSLVGPRPHANAHNELYRELIDGYMLRHKVKPGITGLAQVNGYRGETETLEKMERRIACDHQYIREWSFWMDVKILLKTLRVVVSQRNAY